MIKEFLIITWWFATMELSNFIVLSHKEIEHPKERENTYFIALLDPFCCVTKEAVTPFPELAWKKF